MLISTRKKRQLGTEGVDINVTRCQMLMKFEVCYVCFCNETFKSKYTVSIQNDRNYNLISFPIFKILLAT